MIKNFLKNPCNLYLGLWSIYLLQGTLYDKGSVISRSILVIIMLYTIVETITFLRKCPYNRYIKCLNSIVLLYAIYCFWFYITTGGSVKTRIGEEATILDVIKEPCCSMLPIYVFCLYTIRKYLTLDLLKIWAPIFITIAILGFFADKRLQLEMLAEIGSSREEVTSNAGYKLVYLLPISLVYYKKPIIMYVCTIICMIFVVLTMKRGAILIGGASLCILILHFLKYGSKKLKILVIAVLLLLVIGGTYFWNYLMSSSDYFYFRVMETLDGEDSGRSGLWSSFWNTYLNSDSIINNIFGWGRLGTVMVGDNFAHNDWIEFLIDFGILGVCLFLNYWIGFYKTIKKTKLHELSRFCLQIIFLILIMKTMFSMSILTMEIYITIMLGFCIEDGFNEQFKQNCI